MIVRRKTLDIAENEANRSGNKRHLKEIRASQLAIGIGMYCDVRYNIFQILFEMYFAYSCDLCCLEFTQNYCFNGRDFQYRFDYQMC